MASYISSTPILAKAVYSWIPSFLAIPVPGFPVGQALSSNWLISGYSSYKEFQDLHTHAHEFL